MLKYKTIWELNQAQRRLKRDAYAWDKQHTRATDSLLEFTFKPQAINESKENIAFLIDTGIQYGASFLAVRDNKIQFLGQSLNHSLIEAVAPEDWQKSYSKWAGNREIADSVEATSLGSCIKIANWRDCFVMPKQRGVYDLQTKKRISNRRTIIQVFWEHGFGTWRGHTPTVASIRYGGNRFELEELANLNDKYWDRKYKSEMAAKMTSAFRSINRYVAWPGAW